MQIKDMTVDELKALIRETVEETLDYIVTLLHLPMWLVMWR